VCKRRQHKTKGSLAQHHFGLANQPKFVGLPAIWTMADTAAIPSSVKELKAFIVARGGSTAGCLEVSPRFRAIDCGM
jgi:hypothetical protein